MSTTLTHRNIAHRRFSLMTTLFKALDIWRQRQALKRLDDAALRDIGLTRKDVHREVRRPVWDAPEMWLK